jgi:hypothetical protein
MKKIYAIGVLLFFIAMSAIILFGKYSENLSDKKNDIKDFVTDYSERIMANASTTVAVAKDNTKKNLSAAAENIVAGAASAVSSQVVDPAKKAASHLLKNVLLASVNLLTKDDASDIEGRSDSSCSCR